MELGIEEHGAGLTVVQELLFNLEPRRPSGDAIMFMDDVQEVGGDGVEYPGNDDAIHASPRRIVEAGDVVEDVVLQGEAAKDEEDVAALKGPNG